MNKILQRNINANDEAPKRARHWTNVSAAYALTVALINKVTSLNRHRARNGTDEITDEYQNYVDGYRLSCVD